VGAARGRLAEKVGGLRRDVAQHAGAAENRRVDRLSAFVGNEHVSGVFEVVDVVDE
jgi:hypothetical protein